MQIVGERCNAQGSTEFKRLLLAQDWQAMVQMAERQVAAGARAIDVCCALSERSTEPHDLRELVKRLLVMVPVPIYVDTTDPEAMWEAVNPQNRPVLSRGVVLNSVHGEKIAEFTVPLRAAIAEGDRIVVTAMARPMPLTKEAKLEALQNARERLIMEFGANEDHMIFDPLVFSLATIDPDYANSAKEVLATVRTLRDWHPRAGVVLGISNVSFGFAADQRRIINSVFLKEAREAGVTHAIIDIRELSTDITPEQERIVQSLLFNTDPKAMQRVTRELI